ncbi:MAG: COX15/CtaA family protein [Candidatus Omnitrophica bacterium]|nr:COX15/CtaA family protein [Candidatus Omnitrophota bacterium]
MSRYRFAQLTVVITLILLAAGGLVTSTDSGLSVPDWPLSYGTMFPPMVGGIRYEHTHRLIAGLVGLMVATLAIWTWRTDPRRWVRWLAGGALAAVITQAILGGLTVLWVLPAPVSIAHACVGQLVFSSLACVALVTSPAWAQARGWGAAAPRIRRRGLQAMAVLLVQLLLGAIIRHTGRFVMWHAAWAVVVVVCLVRLAQSLRQAPELPAAWRTRTLLLAWLVVAQAAIGITVWRTGAQWAWMSTGHVVLGAVLLASTCVISTAAHRAAQVGS